MKKYVFLLLIIFFGTLTGCGNEPSLQSLENGTYHYTHPHAGYSITVPRDWVKQAEDDTSVAFTGEKPPVVLNIVAEVGGYGYYSMKQLAEEVIYYLGKQFSNLEAEKLSDDNLTDVYQFTAKGTLKAGAKVEIYTIILEPEVGIRYYLLFTAPTGDLNVLQGLLQDVAGSFEMIKTKDELYQQMSNQGEKNEKQGTNPLDK
jgi:hypothetical protein